MVCFIKAVLYRWLVLCSLFATRAHLRKAGTLTLLRESIIGKDLCNVPMLHNEEWIASVPELDLRHRLCGAQLCVFYRRLDIGRANKGELWWSYSGHCQ